MTTQLVAVAVLAICALLALFMGCLAVVACTWDTPYRLAAIAWMGGGFVVIAIGAAVYRSRAAKTNSPLFAALRREWQEDRVLLERILSSNQD